MAENTGGDTTPENSVNQGEVDFTNPDAAKEAYEKLMNEHSETSEQNKQLFARAKKAEGFELVEDKWVKPEVSKEEPKAEPEPQKESSKPSEIDYGEKAYLRSALDVKGADELQLVKEFKGKYGMSVEEMETDSVFLGKLNNLREARESQAAVPKGTKRSGQQGTTDVDIALAKYKETGKLPEDFKTRSEVVNKAAAQEEQEGMFSGPSVIGPQVQVY